MTAERALALTGVQLAKLDRDLLLALARPHLRRGELGLQLRQPLLLGGGRLGALVDLPLALLDRSLGRGQLGSAAVDLLRADRECLRIDLSVRQRLVQLRELVAQILFADERLREVAAECFELAEVRQRDRRGGCHFDRFGRDRCDGGRRRALRLDGRRSLFTFAAPLELAAKTRAEAPLRLVVLARGHQKSLARLMNAGPRMTRNMAGKMKSTVGKSILIGDFIARSSASA